jgi:hypothetical protein
MGAVIRTTLHLVQEIEAKLVPNKQSKCWGGEIRRITGSKELICGISMLIQEWMVTPKNHLERLVQEWEGVKVEEVPRWKTRIKEILEMI